VVIQAYNLSYLGSRDQKYQSLSKNLTRPHVNKVGMVVHSCYPNYPGGYGQVDQDEARKGKNMRSYLKNNYSKKGWGHAQGVQCLRSECEALSSNSTTTTKKKRGKGRR
jgi:hypothetical protein